MAGLFDGVVQENPLFVDNSEKYAKRAELARDEAMKSEVEAGKYLASALNQADIAKGHADRAELAKGEIDSVIDSVVEIKNEVSGILDEVKVEHIIIDQLINEGKGLSDKFDTDKVEIEGMKVDITADVAQAKVYRDQAEGHSITSKGFSNTSKTYRDEASAYKDSALKSSVDAKAHMDKASLAEMNAAISSDSAKVSENKVKTAINEANIVLGSANTLLGKVESTQVRVEALQGEVLVARDEAAVSHSGALVSEQMAKSSEVKAKDYEAGSEEYYNLVKDLYTDMKEGIVYRGTWNPKTGAYPNALDTNSAWDVITGQSDGVSFGGEMWFAGDKVIYAKEDKKYYHLASASAVQSVNGKTGAVVLTPTDIGALTTKEVYTKTEIDSKGTLGMVDMRSSESRPVDYQIKKATTWFTDKNNPTGGWCSGITFKGWADGYNVWQLLSEAGAGDTSATKNKLFFRSGNMDKWGDYAEVYTSLNKPTANDLNLYTKEEVDGKLSSATVGPDLNLDGKLSFNNINSIRTGASNALSIEAGQFAHFFAGKENANSAIYIGSNVKYDNGWGKHSNSISSCVMELNGSSDLVYYYSPAGNTNPIAEKHSIFTSINPPTAHAVGAYTKAEVDGLIGTGSGGTAGVTTVNGMSGVVNLTAADVGAMAADQSQNTVRVGALKPTIDGNVIQTNGGNFRTEAGLCVSLDANNFVTTTAPNGNYMCQNTMWSGGGWVKHTNGAPGGVLHMLGGELLYNKFSANEHPMDNAYKVYHEGCKPTAADVGALSTAGGDISGELTWDKGTHKIKANGSRFLQIEGGEYAMLTSGRGATADGAVYIGCNLYYDSGWKKYNNGLGSSLLEFTNNKELVMICSNPGYGAYDQIRYKVYHQGNMPTTAEIGAVSTTGGSVSGRLSATTLASDEVDMGAFTISRSANKLRFLV